MWLTSPGTTSCNVTTSAPGLPPVAAETSGQTPTRRPCPLLALSPSTIVPMLFPEDEDYDNGSESEIDIRGYEWTDSGSNEDSSSSDDGEEQLLRNKHNCLGESENSKGSSQRTSAYSFAWSEEEDFVPQLYIFQSDNSSTMEDWPCRNN